MNIDLPEHYTFYAPKLRMVQHEYKEGCAYRLDKGKIMSPQVTSINEIIHKILRFVH